MKRSLKIYLLAICAGIFGHLLSACRGQEDAVPGWCRLECGSTTLASSSFSITSRTQDLLYQCTDGSGPTAKMLPSWLITAPSGGPDGGSIEKSGIGFNVVLTGITPYTNNDPDENSADWHQGVKTPQSEWCSDSCGIARLQIQGECGVETQSGTITIESGAISSQISVSINAPE